MMMRSTMDPEASAEFVRLMGGLDFRSFEDFLSKFSEYQRQTASCFVVRDSITIKRYNEKHPDTPLDEGLRYTYIRYGCVHGKPKRDSRYAESHQRK